MFVGSTLLSAVDRLSVRSSLTGKTGTLLGAIFSILFIALCIVMFIGPVINFFRGDYHQGTFFSLNHEDQQLYSGCDFKMAIAFFDKNSGKVIDHREVVNMLDVQMLYSSGDGDTFYAPVNDCTPGYFGDSDILPTDQGEHSCFTFQDYFGFFSELEGGYYSIIGFTVQPICNDPFLCTYGSETEEQITKLKLEFFESHYYAVYFTSQQINRLGQIEMQYHTVYSSEWSGHRTVMPYLYILWQTEKIYIDDSIMPWRNNRTQLIQAWYGMTWGVQIDNISFQSYGVSTYISIMEDQQVIIRQYRKLDWLLGLIGGGVFLLFIFFFVPCNYISELKARKKACESLVILKQRQFIGQQALNPPKIPISWYFTNWMTFLPFFSCLKNCLKLQSSHQLVEISDRAMDITTLIKKQKVALRNIRRYQKSSRKDIKNIYNIKRDLMFEKRRLEFYEQAPGQMSEKFELFDKQIQCIKESPEIPEIYKTNAMILSLNNSKDAEKNLAKIEKGYDQYSKFKKSFKSSFRSRCRKITLQLAKFVRLFDIFGAKPMLTGFPHNYSFCGCLITMLIVVLAILTFALTLHNMGNTRLKMDEIYVAPEDYSIAMGSNQQIKMLFCVGQYAMDNNLIIGEDRVGDVKFYQYKRVGTEETVQEFSPISLKDTPSQYFEISNERYQNKFQNCFKPPNNVQFSIKGSEETEQQQYFGVTLKPFCSGTPTFCKQNQQSRMTKYSYLYNILPLYLYLPQNQYYPDEGQIIEDFTWKKINLFAVGLSITNISQSITDTIYSGIIQIIDDSQSWLIEPKTQPVYQTLTNQILHLDYNTHVPENENFQYKAKIKFNGKMRRIISTNYKADFLLATIGGCFMFFYIIFGCWGKMFNNYFLKAKLAEELYAESEDGGVSGCFQSLMKCLKLPCADDKVMQKISEDLDSINLTLRVENCYNLSSTFHDSLQARQLSLVYLKQIVKEQDDIFSPISEQEILEVIQEEEEDQDESEFNDVSDQQKRRLEQALIRNTSSAVANEQGESTTKVLQEKQIEIDDNMQEQEVIQTLPYTNRSKQCCKSFINNFDMFNNNANLTIDGKRQIRSICGGICCMILLAFIVLLTSHYLTIYFDKNLFVLSNEKKSSERSQEDLKMSLTTGKDFKFLIHFIKKDDFRWQNVSEQVPNINMTLLKFKTTRINNTIRTQAFENITLVPCPENYLDGFLGEYKSNIYQNLTLGYCVPDGTQLSMYGSPHDQVREYFKIHIRNAELNQVSFSYIEDFLGKYIPVYHISTPIKDFQDYGGQNTVRYHMLSLMNHLNIQFYAYRSSNITLAKAQVNYDTAVNPSNEYQSIDTYNVITYLYADYTWYGTEEDGGAYDMYTELSFALEDYMALYTIKRIKANQMFGIIGGAILFVFFGIGILPKSFNEYRMRIIIASKLYTIRPSKKLKKSNVKRKKGKINKERINSEQESFEEYNNFSEWRIFRAWLLSFWGFVREDYQQNKTLKLVSLIESRVSHDMNLLNFYKNILICESYLRKSKKLSMKEKITDILKLRPKIVVPQDLRYQIIEGNQIDHDLRYLAKKNDLSDWDVNAILIAKTKNINPVNIFTQKWLDAYFGARRAPSQMANSDASSELSSNFNRVLQADRDKNIDISSMNQDVQSHGIE